MSKKKKTILIVALLLVVFIGSISYALWSVTLEQTDSNIVKTGCFETTMEEKTAALNLPEEFPIKDEEAADYDPFTFTIQNTCTIDASYSVNLKVESGTDLDVQYLKTVLDNEEPRVLTAYEKATNEEKYQLATGTLRGASSENADDGESVTYNLRLWLDENTPESQMSKVFNGKIVIESITTRASKVLATGDISATEADNVTYTLYEDGLLKISGTGATKGYESGSVFEEVLVLVFETKCTEAGLDCGELITAFANGDTSVSDIIEIYSNYDSLIDMVLDSGQMAQSDLDAMGVTSDAQLVNLMLGVELDEENTTACLEIIKTLNIEITDLKIEEGITSIGARVFGWATDLAYVDFSAVDLRLPSTITTIGDNAFNRTGVNSITLNEGLVTIGNKSFFNTTLKNIPSTVALIANGFSYAIFSEVVDLSSYEVIPASAFFNSTFEKGIILSDGLKEIQTSAFYGSNLSGEIVIPNTVEKIGTSVFGGTQISSLKLPENDVYHGFEEAAGGSAGICSGCMNLKEVEIPLNVYNLVSVGQDLIWGESRNAPEGAKYIMPIKASEYGENYRIYSIAFNTGFVDLGPVTSFEYNDAVTLEWQPE